MATLANRSVTGTPGQPIYLGKAAPLPGGEVARIFLANESAGVQAADSVAPMFGMVFKEGDIPEGNLPTFETLSGVQCPATIMLANNWPNGTMRRCSVLMRVPVSVESGEELTVVCKNGGAQYGPSNRANSDLTASDLKIDFAGVLNLTGAWSGSLNAALADGADVTVYGDGPAGRVIRVAGFAKQGATAHPHLYCWHYVQLLQGPFGGLAGIRHMGRFGLPFQDVAGANRMTATIALRSGATTLRSMIGHDLSSTSTGPDIGIDQYSTSYTCGQSARYDFIAGTQPTECVLRVKHSPTQIVRSRVMPSYDTALTFTSTTPATDYVPYCAGAMVRGMGGTGERADIGLFPDWVARHLITQAAADDRRIRVTGLASGGWRTNLRESTNRQPAIHNDIRPAYSGLGPIRTTGRTYGPNGEWGTTSIPATRDSRWSGETTSDHRPASASWPYLSTGEPQYLDLLTEHATQIIGSTGPGTKTINTNVAPITASNQQTWAGERNARFSGNNVIYKGTGNITYAGSGGLLRLAAWATRDIAVAAALYPDLCPYNTDIRLYFNDVIGSCHAVFNDYNDAVVALGYPNWKTDGLFTFGSVYNSGNGWNTTYATFSFAYQAQLLKTPAAINVRNHFARFWENASTRPYAVQALSGFQALYHKEGGQLIGSFDELVNQLGGASFQGNSANNTISVIVVSDPYFNDNWIPTNGDLFCVYVTVPSVNGSKSYPSLGMTPYKRHHIVNAVGQTFQISETPGGPPLPITNDDIYSNVYIRTVSYSSYSFVTNTGYMGQQYAAVQYLAAEGASVATAQTRFGELWAQAGAPSMATRPRVSMINTYPE